MTSRNRTNRRRVALVALIPLLGCATEPASEEPPAPVAVEAESLAVPFTAEQIRDEFRKTTWRAFWLTSVEGGQIKEVADKLGISVGAVYIARSRVMARLRQTIERLEGK